VTTPVQPSGSCFFVFPGGVLLPLQRMPKNATRTVAIRLASVGDGDGEGDGVGVGAGSGVAGVATGTLALVELAREQAPDAGAASTTATSRRASPTLRVALTVPGG
jgi:hypothetical protein